MICNKRFKRDVNNKFRRVRDTSESNVLNLYCNLMVYNWEKLYKEKDVNNAYKTFLEIFIDLYNTTCPFKTIRVKHNMFKPWFTEGLKAACKKKNLMYKKYLKNKSCLTEAKYKTYKNKLTYILRAAEIEYYNKKLIESKSDIKRMWSTLNSVIKSKSVIAYPEEFEQEGKLLSNKTDIASEFNKFFVNVGPDLANKIIAPPNMHVYDFMKGKNKKSMNVEDVNTDEIVKIVNNFKSKMSCDVNDINMNILKKIIIAIVQPLKYICNLSLNTGVFPDDMKIARVIPLFKAGNNNVFTNYRPVSILPQFSKILEKIFNNRLDNFIEKHKILTDSQYGFRRNRSTSLALIELIEKITESLDSKRTTVGVFIDLKKAFDTIDHQLLLKKLYFYGVRGTALNWIEPYLTNRQQYVHLGDVKSELLKVLCGVPQGSILGPKLFIIYINDICNVSKLLDLILFADDTKSFYTGTNLDNISEVITGELEKINVWFSLNKLSLNVSKTNYMIFSNKNIKDGDASIIFNGQEIKEVQYTKFLGVLINKISNLISKLNFYKLIPYPMDNCFTGRRDQSRQTSEKDHII